VFACVHCADSSALCVCVCVRARAYVCVRMRAHVCRRVHALTHVCVWLGERVCARVLHACDTPQPTAVLNDAQVTPIMHDGSMRRHAWIHAQIRLHLTARSNTMS
jgi:hypothetical protein